MKYPLHFSFPFFIPYAVFFRAFKLLHIVPFPVESLIKENQSEYYNALNSSDSSADSTSFIEFMLSLLLKTIEEIIETEKKVTVKVSVKVTVNQQRILDAIQANPFVTQKELAHSIGLSRKSIIQNMKKLQENGLLKRVGADKNGHWEIEG